MDALLASKAGRARYHGPTSSIFPRMHKDTITTPRGVRVESRFIDNRSDRTIAFFNGWATVSSAEWRWQMLGIRDYNMVFHNNMGMGKSEMTPKRYLHTCAHNMKDVCRHYGITDVELVGHSMGGLLATLFYATPKYHEGITVRTMTYVNSPDSTPLRSFPYAWALPSDIDPFIESLSEGRLSKAIALIERNRFARKAANSIASGLGVRISQKSFNSMFHSFLGRRIENAAALRAMLEHGHEIAGLMGDIDVPLLIMGAEKDFFVSVDAAWRMHMGMADSQIAIFKHSTHAPMIEEHERFNEILLSFLRANSPSRFTTSQEG